ncbi:hypothetical protein GCM10025867_50080 (plasmid) [Frondihabitans sucicola]|uniref:Uncharacterized protein n=1 Tax=Frondihabitans sucicola TaxID=1268041 RepID=A0ABM8GWC8_9MICO|nr:hypothetical protein [Frondihabitans sucicola]BDZ52767.1 hypothetical protein GCM10025867_50080 [Frondihabitans sucicola]
MIVNVSFVALLAAGITLAVFAFRAYLAPGQHAYHLVIKPSRAQIDTYGDFVVKMEARCMSFGVSALALLFGAFTVVNFDAVSGWTRGLIDFVAQ